MKIAEIRKLDENNSAGLSRYRMKHAAFSAIATDWPRRDQGV